MTSGHDGNITAQAQQIAHGAAQRLGAPVGSIDYIAVLAMAYACADDDDVRLAFNGLVMQLRAESEARR